MINTKHLLPILVALFVSPIAANAGLIEEGGYEDWEFDVSSIDDEFIRQWGYLSDAADKLDSGAGIAIAFGTAQGQFDLVSFLFTNQFPNGIGNVGTGMSLTLPVGLDFLYARVSYVDDSFSFDRMRIGYGYGAASTTIYGRQVGSGTITVPVPEPGSLALIGAGLFGMATRRRRRTQVGR